MVYLLESRLDENKSVYFGLMSVYGINRIRSLKICRMLGFSSNFKIKNLSSGQVRKISRLIEFLSFIVANDLKKLNLMQNQKLLSIKSYRGLRRKKGFPVRGQRTHTNAQTAKRNKKRV